MNQAMNESKTPRTDAAEIEHSGNCAHCSIDGHLSESFGDFARQLESELAASKAREREWVENFAKAKELQRGMELVAADAQAELAASHAQNERLLSLVRLQRGELHQKDAISDEEYANLAADVSSRTVLNTHDTLRGEIAVLERQIQKRDNALAAIKAREDRLAEALADISSESQNYQCRGDARDHQTFESCISTAEKALSAWRAAK